MASVLNSGKGYTISPNDSKLKKEVSEAFKQSKDSGKYSPLVGVGSDAVGVKIHDNKPNSFVKGGSMKNPAGPSDPARKKVNFS